MAAESRVGTGIVGLDAMLNGGFVRESAILVRGAPGTGKTTLALHYLLEGAKQGEPGLLISFEEFPKSVYRDAESLGWDLAKSEADGSLRMMFTSPEVLLRSLEIPDSPLMKLLWDTQIARVVVDSLSHFSRLRVDTFELRNIYNTIVNGFRREGLTSLFIGEETRDDFTSQEKGKLSFVVDCILMMRYLEIESSIRRAMFVLKMRSSDHDKSIHDFSIGIGGITVGKAMEGHIGLLSGLSQHSMISTVQVARKTKP